MRLRPNDGGSYLQRGFARVQLNFDREAVEDFTMAISLDSQSAAAYLSRGLAKLKLRRVDEARADLERAAAMGHDQAGPAIEILNSASEAQSATADYDRLRALGDSCIEHHQAVTEAYDSFVQFFAEGASLTNAPAIEGVARGSLPATTRHIG